ncbi:cytochrome P450 [Actinomadura soli]|uniref:Cytochrome P450 n=2 Tax=Actinomadura soli TaxID=2508997 RepID=A0A5C4J6I3_9ACTN|nr:cytochrome P450 [Actinomadura soli]
MDDATPWRMFEALRRSEPVHWNPEPDGGSGFWSLTRHADIVAAGRDSATFTSEKFVNLEEVDERQAEIRRSMLEMDGPRHLALRRLLSREFTPRAVAGYATFLRGLTGRTLDAALAKGTFDFVAEIAADFPINVLARMLDVPDGDTRRLIDWGNRIIANTDPEYADVLLNSAESERYRDLPFRSPASLEAFEYGRELAARRRGGEGTDLISRLVNQTPIDGEPLSARDFDNYFLLLVVAGNETTRHAITHAMRALIDHPEQAERLRAEPGLMPTAVEEFLRWASPVYHFRRTATRDTEVNGTPIGAGDKVVLWFASANRDEAVFADPGRFDVTRGPNDHIAFGKGGPHYCLGAALARLEMRIMFEELLPRLSDVRLAGDVRRVRSNFVNGIKRMPVTVTLA